jgi:flavin reductase (DIM6/NTAB) family NADH-FMN oxidoreductase RutF
MREVPLSELSVRPFTLLDRQWAILVGGAERPNPMTVSWGGMGTLWNRPTVTIYVRPTRYTYELLEAHREFTLNFLADEGRAALNVCGSVSGRDQDKWKLSGLVRENSQRVRVPRIAGARLLFECRVLAHVDIDPSRFVDSSLNKLYPLSDYHRVYFGEVLLVGEGN